MPETKSSSYLVANTDHRYRFLANFHNTVHTFKPDSKEEGDEVFFNNCEELAEKYDVSLISVDDLGDKDRFTRNFSSIISKLNLSKEDEEQLEDLKNEMLDEDDFKELFSDYLRYEFGIRNSIEGGLFYIEPIEGGVNVKFAHIDDVRELDEERRNTFTKSVFRAKEHSYVENETFTSSPTLNFEIFDYNEEDIEELTDEESSYLLKILEKNRKKRYEKSQKKLIIKYRLEFDVLIPDKEGKVNLDPVRNKALYFLVLASNPDGIKFQELNNKNVYKQNLIRIYKKLKNTFAENEDKDYSKTISDIVKNKKELSTLKSRTKKKIETYLSSQTDNLNEIEDIISQISYVDTKKLFKIPVDRSAVSVINPMNKNSDNTGTIQDFLNEKFNLIDSRKKK